MPVYSAVAVTESTGVAPATGAVTPAIARISIVCSAAGAGGAGGAGGVPPPPPPEGGETGAADCVGVTVGVGVGDAVGVGSGDAVGVGIAAGVELGVGAGEAEGVGSLFGCALGVGETKGKATAGEIEATYNFNKVKELLNVNGSFACAITLFATRTWKISFLTTLNFFVIEPIP